MENYHKYNDFGLLTHTEDGAYPLRADYQKGYNLSFTDNGDGVFRTRTRTNASSVSSKGVTPTSTFSRPRSRATGGRLGRQKL
mgnify:CR=1 FL=1